MATKKQPKAKANAKAGKKSAKAKKDEGRKPRAAAPASRHVDAQGDDIRRDVSDKDIKYLAKYADESTNKARHITSLLGQEISAYSKKGLDATAFRRAFQFLRMGKRDLNKLCSVYRNFERYLVVMGVLDMIDGATKDMFKDDPPKPRGPRKFKQIDLSEREDIPAPSDESVDDGNESGQDNVTSLDDHRQTEDAAA